MIDFLEMSKILNEISNTSVSINAYETLDGTDDQPLKNKKKKKKNLNDNELTNDESN